MSLATMWRRRLSLFLLRGSSTLRAIGKLVVAKALREAAQVQSLAARLIGSRQAAASYVEVKAQRVPAACAGDSAFQRSW